MKKAFGVLMLAAAILLAPLAASARFTQVSRVEICGTVKLNGTSAPAGTVIGIYKGTTRLKEYTLKQAGHYETFLESRYAKAGDTLTFKVGGISAGSQVVAAGKSYDLSVTGQVKGATAQAVRDGDIIQCKNSSNPFAVYIVKIASGRKYIRHITSPQIFRLYPHLRWENLIQVDSLDGYFLSPWVRLAPGATSQPSASGRVFEVNADQTRHWLDMTAEQFSRYGGSEDAVFGINLGELKLYAEGDAVKIN